MTIRHLALVPFLLSGAILVSGCMRDKKDDSGDSPQSTNATQPAPTAAPPPAATDTTPVTATAAPPPPPQAPRAVTPPAATTPQTTAASTAECRKKAIIACTTTCDAKVNEKTHGDPTKRRIAHDLCFAECTRASLKICP